MAERKTRISAKLREAIRLMVEEGMNRSDAAQKVGMKDNSLYVALRRPEVLAVRTRLMKVLRESEASRTISRVARLADTAQSEHVRLGANEFLAGIEGIAPVARGEVVHRHEGQVPGLTIVFSDHPREIGGPVIDGVARPALDGNGQPLPIPVPHPALARRKFRE
jgi:transposase-like protein